VARLIYATIASLDGYITDTDGNFDWAAPDEEVHGFINDLERPIGTYLYGRRMYQVMVAWEAICESDATSAVTRDYAAIWRAADKIVYSTTLPAVSSARSRLEREFEPHAVRELKDSVDRDLGIGGPALAAQAIGAGLVDELHMILLPVVIGGGTPALGRSVRCDLDLVEDRSFGNGTMYLRYLVKPGR
jgi:dihydrofolate reductase